MVKNGYVYTPAELLKHLTMLIIPHQRHKTVLDHSMNLPTHPTMPISGQGQQMLLHCCFVAMDKEYEDKSVQPRINECLEQEQMEEHGIGDQLREMKQNRYSKKQR